MPRALPLGREKSFDAIKMAVSGVKRSGCPGGQPACLRTDPGPLQPVPGECEARRACAALTGAGGCSGLFPLKVSVEARGSAPLPLLPVLPVNQKAGGGGVLCQAWGQALLPLGDPTLPHSPPIAHPAPAPQTELCHCPQDSGHPGESYLSNRPRVLRTSG